MTKSGKNTYDLILTGGQLVTPAGIIATDLALMDGKIAAIGALAGERAASTMDISGLTVLPGIIDTHVHFREPGLTHKEDIATGSLAAIMGGVTTIFEMPNTDPLTVDAKTFTDKMARAQNRSFCDYAFYIGGCADNADILPQLERLEGCAGVKVFMGSSTGALLAEDDATLERIFASSKRLIAVHAEDEPRLIERKSLAGSDVVNHPLWRDAQTALTATTRALRIARKLNRRLHFLHVTTAEEMALLAAFKDIASVETTPQHLSFSAPDCYTNLGTRAQMNPPIRDESHRRALWLAVQNGVVDTLGSDHAPHTLDEKAKPYPQSPSGMPGVQTILPVMLDHVARGNLTLMRLVDLLCHGPARIYQIAGKGRLAVGYDADLAIVDLNRPHVMRDQDMLSKCGWTPYAGQTMLGCVVATVLRGRIIQFDGEVLQTSDGQSAFGKPARFLDALDSQKQDKSGDWQKTVTAPPHTCCH